jgi:S-adenosylmethionine decarboxylase
MTNPTQCFGVHFMIDGYAASAALLADRDHLERLLYDLPDAIGMHRIAPPQIVEVGPLNPKDSGGISGFVIIAESHFSFHTFPARGFVTADLYTCQDEIDRDDVIRRLKAAFGLIDADVFVQNRGLRFPSVDMVPPGAMAEAGLGAAL